MSKVDEITDSAARKFLEDKLDEIQRVFAPQHIILYGSRATGQAREDSDIDLIVVSDHFRDMRFADRIAKFLIEIRPEREVEPLCYTPEEFEEMRNRISIVALAAREGVWIQ